MSNEHAIQAVLTNRELNRSVQMLMGIVTGIVADGRLHDMEIQMLSTWLSANSDVASRWPGSAIARQLEVVLADGIISEEERAHLLSELQGLAGTDFSDTGSVTAEVVALPYDTEAQIDVRDLGICHTGEFVFGTRAACERLTSMAGGLCLSSVSKKVAFLVIGSHVSPAWSNTSYGRKIEQAMTLKQSGHPIAIVSEKRWLEALKA